MRLSVCGLLVVAMAAGCGLPPNDRGDGMIDPGIPDAVGEWRAVGVPETYDTETIYSYIDGHAEVYLAYGMKRCLSRRYSGPGGDGEVVVDLFEMASAPDAFGVFSHDRAGEPVPVGQGGVFRHGWLSFWQGDWYGSVYSSGSGEGLREAVLAIGDAVAAGLPGGGDVPALVGRLPVDGLEAQSVCYLRSPQILNAHVWIGSDNPFGLGPGVEAVVGTYLLDDSDLQLLLVRYPNEDAAANVESRIRASGAGSAGELPAMTVGRAGDLVAAVIGPDAGEAGERLLERALGGGA